MTRHALLAVDPPLELVCPPLPPPPPASTVTITEVMPVGTVNVPLAVNTCELVPVKLLIVAQVWSPRR